VSAQHLAQVGVEWVAASGHDHADAVGVVDDVACSSAVLACPFVAAEYGLACPGPAWVAVDLLPWVGVAAVVVAFVPVGLVYRTSVVASAVGVWLEGVAATRFDT
jgi:hypothetical protein